MLVLAAALLAAPDPLAPLDWLVGHCWQGEPVGGVVDTHCFARSDAGVRDHHKVEWPAGVIFEGDTDYDWDAAGRRIRFRYGGGKGPASEGTLVATDERLDFGGGLSWRRGPDGRSFTLVTGDTARTFVRVD
jgi:hypothetical protein